MATREFVEQPFYIESPFSLRLLAAIEPALKARRYRVVNAPSFSGKSTTLENAEESRRRKTHLGETTFDFLLLPPITSRRWAHTDIVSALIASIGRIASNGISPRGGQDRVSWLVERFRAAGARGIIFDDANKMDDAGLEATHQLREEFKRRGQRIGIVFACAAFHSENPLHEYFYASRSGSELEQRKSRLVRVDPFVHIGNHTLSEMRPLLAAFEDQYRPQFPDLELVPFVGSIYEWLCMPSFDEDGLGEVRMGTLDDLIRAGLEAAAGRGLYDLGPNLSVLQEAAELISLGAVPKRSTGDVQPR